MHQYNSSGYNSRMERSVRFLQVRSPTALTSSSFPMCKFSTICKLPFSSIPFLILDVLSLWYKLCLSLSRTKYSWWNPFNAIFFTFQCIYCVTFFKFELSSNSNYFLQSSDVRSLTGIKIMSRSRIIRFDVNGSCRTLVAFCLNFLRYLVVSLLLLFLSLKLTFI